jgi:hypothetical protein
MNPRRPTRRELLEALIWGAVPGWVTVPRAARAANQTRFSSRRYRIDTTVLFFGAPILTRAGVGGAYLAADHHGDAEGSSLSLEFAAGSWPERAHGIRRMGFFRETQERRSGELPRPLSSAS